MDQYGVPPSHSLGRRLLGVAILLAVAAVAFVFFHGDADKWLVSSGEVLIGWFRSVAPLALLP